MEYLTSIANRLSAKLSTRNSLHRNLEIGLGILDLSTIKISKKVIPAVHDSANQQAENFETFTTDLVSGFYF